VSRPWASSPKLRSCSSSGHLEGRPLGQVERSLALVADDPQAGESRVHGEPRHAHDVIVVPEQRCALVHRVVADGVLTGGEDVLRPAVIGRRRQPAVQMHDREAQQHGGARIGGAPAETRPALHRNTVATALGRRYRDHHRQRPLDLVAPPHPYPVAALGLDRRAGDGTVVTPDPRLRQVAVKAMTPGAHDNRQLPLVLAGQQAARHRQGVDKGRERRPQRRRRERLHPFAARLIPILLVRVRSGHLAPSSPVHPSP
jgi:hypothetical protein